MAPIVAATPWGEPGHDFVAQFRVRTLHTNNQVNPGQREGFEKVQAFLVDS